MTTIILEPDVEAIVEGIAQRDGRTHQQIVMDTLRARFAPLIPAQDDWERAIDAMARKSGVVLTDEQISREFLYE